MEGWRTDSVEERNLLRFSRRGLCVSFRVYVRVCGCTSVHLSSASLSD